MKTLKLSKKELFTIYIAIGELENTDMWSDFLNKKQIKAVHNGMNSLGTRFLDELDKKEYLIEEKEKPSEPDRPYHESYNEVMIKNIIKGVKIRISTFPENDIEFLYNENDYVVGVKYGDEEIRPTLINEVMDFITDKYNKTKNITK